MLIYGSEVINWHCIASGSLTAAAGGVPSFALPFTALFAMNARSWIRVPRLHRTRNHKCDGMAGQGGCRRDDPGLIFIFFALTGFFSHARPRVVT
jgi:hypothetical protein